MNYPAKKCVVCGERFYRIPGPAKTCGKECAKIHNAKVLREWKLKPGSKERIKIKNRRYNTSLKGVIQRKNIRKLDGFRRTRKKWKMRVRRAIFEIGMVSVLGKLEQVKSMHEMTIEDQMEEQIALQCDAMRGFSVAQLRDAIRDSVVSIWQSCYRIAAAVRMLQEAGEDLSFLNEGWGKWALLLAKCKVLPETLRLFNDKPRMLNAVARLPLQAQEEICKNDPIEVLVGEDKVIEVRPTEIRHKDVGKVVGPNGLRTVEEQRWTNKARPTVTMDDLGTGVEKQICGELKAIPEREGAIFKLAAVTVFFSLHNLEKIVAELNAKKKIVVPIMGEARMLVEKNQEIVIVAAKAIRKSISHMVSFDELVSAGNIGLIKAAKDFDSSKGNFSSYAALRIRGEIIDYTREVDYLSRRFRSRKKRSESMVSDFISRKGMTPTAEDIAADHGMTIPEAAEVLGNSSRNSQVELDTSFQGLVEPESSENEDLWRECFKGLSINHQKVVSSYYRDGKALSEVGKLLNISESRASQLRSEALGIIKSRMTEEQLLELVNP